MPAAAEAQKVAGRRDARVKKEASRLLNDNNTLEQNGIYIDPESARNSTDKWIAYIQGPQCSVWSGGVFKMEIEFPKNYPFQVGRRRSFVRDLSS